MAGEFIDAGKRFSGIVSRNRRIGAYRQWQQIAAQGAAECHRMSAGQTLGQIQHRRNSDATADEDAQAIFARKRKSIAKPAQNESVIADFQFAEPIGADSHDAVDDVQFDAIG